MLVELHVVGLGVIEDCRISLSGGLTALTGETGAGKTILVDALDLVLGGKPRRGLVPEGRTALVEAVFDDGQGGELVLAREVPSEGRARAWIDGRMASVAALEDPSPSMTVNSSCWSPMSRPSSLSLTSSRDAAMATTPSALSPIQSPTLTSPASVRVSRTARVTSPATTWQAEAAMAAAFSSTPASGS